MSIYLVRQLTVGRMKAIRLFAVALLCYFSAVHAAQMRIDTPSSGFAIDEVFVVEVMLDATNTGNEDVVVADAVIQYETEMLELVNVLSDSNSDSDFYYGYTLPTNTFPIVTTDSGSALGAVQIVVGLPGSAPVLSGETNARVARLEFRAKQPPEGRTDNSTNIEFVYTDGSDYTQSKVIANDGLGTNILTGVSPAMIFIGASDTNVPLPAWSYWILALLFLSAVTYLIRTNHSHYGQTMSAGV